MARRNKLWRFAQLQSYDNYYEASVDGPRPGHEVIGSSGEPEDMRGRWARDHFGNDNPITLELACGRGEYTVALARAHPDRNFIGVDIKGARIYQGATELREEGVTNAAFLRTRIEFIDHFFALGEVDEVWITFPDPFPGSVNRRLTSPRFWTSYARLVRCGGYVHLKTDNEGLYDYTVNELDAAHLRHFTEVANYHDIDAEPQLPHPELAYPTYYERKHRGLGATIKWVSWQRNELAPPSPFRYGAEAAPTSTHEAED